MPQNQNVAIDVQGRVVRAAEAALVQSNVVSPIDVLIGVGRLAPAHAYRTHWVSPDPSPGKR